MTQGIQAILGSGVHLLMLKLQEGNKPMHLRIANAIRTAIDERRIGASEPLPSTRALAEQLGVHRHTVSAAVEELAAEGWVIARNRAADRVNPQLPMRSSRATSPATVHAGKFEWARCLQRPNMPPAASRLDRHAMAYALNDSGPDLRLLPVSEIRSCMRTAMHTHRPEVLSYGSVDGAPHLIEAITDYLARSRGIRGRQIIVTNGSAECFMLISLLLLGPRKRAAMNALCYRPLAALFRLVGAEIVPLAMDAHGVRPDALEPI